MALRTESVINFMAICRVQLQLWCPLEPSRNCHVPFDFSRLPNTRSTRIDSVDSPDLDQARREAAHKIVSFSIDNFALVGKV